MNKDDIFLIDKTNSRTTIYLSWDRDKGVQFSRLISTLVPPEIQAIGMLWQAYGDEIIAHIQEAVK